MNKVRPYDSQDVFSESYPSIISTETSNVNKIKRIFDIRLQNKILYLLFFSIIGFALIILWVNPIWYTTEKTIDGVKKISYLKGCEHIYNFGTFFEDLVLEGNAAQFYQLRGCDNDTELAKRVENVDARIPSLKLDEEDHTMMKMIIFKLNQVRSAENCDLGDVSFENYHGVFFHDFVYEYLRSLNVMISSQFETSTSGYLFSMSLFIQIYHKLCHFYLHVVEFIHIQDESVRQEFNIDYQMVMSKDKFLKDISSSAFFNMYTNLYEEYSNYFSEMEQIKDYYNGNYSKVIYTEHEFFAQFEKMLSFFSQLMKYQYDEFSTTFQDDVIVDFVYIWINLFMSFFVTVLFVISLLVYNRASVKPMKNQLTEICKKILKFIPVQFFKFLDIDDFQNIPDNTFKKLKRTCMFVDIRDFTNICSLMRSPIGIANMLSSLWRLVIPIVKVNNGFIEKFLGDGSLCIFDKPKSAIYAAISIQLQLKEKNLRFSVGIGIHHGQVLAGFIGNEHRLEATVIGDAVNICSRIEEMTKTLNCGIISSENDDLSSFKHKSLGKHEVRGISGKMELYKIFDDAQISETSDD